MTLPMDGINVLDSVVMPGANADANLAAALCDYCLERIAYYKAPGWVLFMDEVPTTGTQKIQKHRLFAEGDDPLSRLGIVDLRDRKRRR